jgi:hypothetical protein
MKISKIQWTLIILTFTIAAGGVQIALANDIYLPLIIANPSLTPTITPSTTPTLTPTSSPTPTATPDNAILIEEIVNSDSMDPFDEYISIRNYKSSSVTLTGWFIRDDGENRYDFPEGFIITGNKTVRIWTKEGGDTDTDLFWGSPVEVWNDVQDCAYLRDDSEGENELVDVYCYSKTGSDMIQVTASPLIEPILKIYHR